MFNIHTAIQLSWPALLWRLLLTLLLLLALAGPGLTLFRSVTHRSEGHTAPTLGQGDGRWRLEESR